MSRSSQVRKGRAGGFIRSILSADRIIFFIKRIGVWGGLAVFIIWLLVWFFLSGSHIKTYDWVKASAISGSASIGFRVENLIVEGRQYTDVDDLQSALGIAHGSPLFGFDLDQTRKSLIRLSWVEALHIERRLPDTVYVKIVERTPLALWQHQKKLFLVDQQGAVITEDNLSAFKDYVTLIGAGAPQSAPAFMRALAAEPALIPYIDSLRRVSDRRWDIILTQGGIVQLPEENVELSLRRLAQFHAENKVLDKNILNIDIRHHSRIVIKNKSGQTEDYTTNP